MNYWLNMSVSDKLALLLYWVCNSYCRNRWVLLYSDCSVMSFTFSFMLHVVNVSLLGLQSDSCYLSKPHDKMFHLVLWTPTSQCSRIILERFRMNNSASQTPVRQTTAHYWNYFSWNYFSSLWCTFTTQVQSCLRKAIRRLFCFPHLLCQQCDTL